MNTKFSARAMRALAGAAAALTFPTFALASADTAAAPSPGAPGAANDNADVALQAAPATAQDSRYWALHAGINKQASWPAQVNFGGPVVPANLELSPGTHLGLLWGRQRERARYELEYQHGKIDIERATIGTRSAAVNVSGSYDVLTANALHHRSFGKDGTLYAGLGVGVGRVKLPQVALVPNCSCLAPASKTGLVWQARAGIEHAVTKSGFVFGQLGYLKVPGPKSEGAGGVSYRNRGLAIASIGYRHQY